MNTTLITGASSGIGGRVIRGDQGLDQAHARAIRFPYAEPNTCAYAGPQPPPNYAAHAHTHTCACSKTGANQQTGFRSTAYGQTSAGSAACIGGERTHPSCARPTARACA